MAGLPASPPAARETLRGERGFMLVELLVTCVLMLIIVGAVLTVLEQTTRISAEDRERALVLREAQAQLDGLVREARHAYRVNAATASRLDLDVHIQGRTRRVVIDCTGAHPTLAGLRRCTRSEVSAAGATTSTRVLVDRVASPDVFATTTDAGVVTYVRVTLRVPASGERGTGPRHEVRLEDGFALRNAGALT